MIYNMTQKSIQTFDEWNERNKFTQKIESVELFRVTSWYILELLGLFSLMVD